MAFLDDSIVAAQISTLVQHDKPTKKLRDGDGLYLILQRPGPGCGGRHYWQYRYRVAGRESSVSLGQYAPGERGHVSIVDARKERDECYRHVKAGNDPARERRKAREAQYVERVTTLGSVGLKYLEHDDSLAPRTKAKHRWQFAKLKPLHNRPITQISTADLVKVCRTIEASNDRREAAHRAAQFARAIFRFAIQEGAVPPGFANPADQMRGALKPKQSTNHPAIIEPEAFGLIVQCIDSTGYASPTVRNALRLIVRVVLRPGELRGGLWHEVDFARKVWTIPEGRMKQRKLHKVPLSKQAIAILQEQQEITGDGDLIFPGERSGRPLSDATMNQALRNFVSSDLQTIHGFRSSFSTILHEQGEDNELIELSLSHGKRDAVRGAYDKSTRIKDRAALMQRWADLVGELAAAKRSAMDFVNAINHGTIEPPTPVSTEA